MMLATSCIPSSRLQAALPDRRFIRTLSPPLFCVVAELDRGWFPPLSKSSQLKPRRTSSGSACASPPCWGSSVTTHPRGRPDPQARRAPPAARFRQLLSVTPPVWRRRAANGTPAASGVRHRRRVAGGIFRSGPGLPVRRFGMPRRTNAQELGAWSGASQSVLSAVLTLGPWVNFGYWTIAFGP